MALTKPQTNKFETPEDGDVIENGDAGTQAGAETKTLTADERVAAATAKKAAEQAAAAAAAPSTSREVAAPANTAVSTATANILTADPFKALENALKVDYNTLTQLQVNQGNVLLKESKETLGDYVVLEILSFQAQWVCSPGGDQNDDESKEFLKYSDDGIHVKGSDELLTDALAAAKSAGYNDARIAERQILVGALVFPGKNKKGEVHENLRDELIQIDLAPQSKNNFQAFRINAAFKASRNRITAEQARTVKMSTNVVTKGKNTWTNAEFSVATEEDMK